MKSKYQAIALELDAMCKIDQDMRERFNQTREDGDWDEGIDHKNTARMKEIVNEIGWPTISKVGFRGASNAWLLLQHADHDVEFQKRCLGLMKAVPEGEVHKKDIALLEDRIAISEGRPQIYGTQCQRNSDGTFEPLPVIDSENLHNRRKEVGLCTIEEYIQHIEEKYGKVK